MELYIQHSNNIHLATAAAFLRGSDSINWLKEINEWNLGVDELECYLLPSANLPAKPSGLFVIFKDAEKIRNIDLLEPYGCIEQKLFIPVNARLMPEVSNEELKNLLIWKRQVFNPAIGFVGFEEKDQVDIPNLFFYNRPLTIDWSFAHPGLPPKPDFKQIQINQPTAEELIDAIKKDIGQQALNKIPIKPEDKQSALEKALDNAKSGLLKGVLSVSSLIENILPKNNNNSTANPGGLFQKLQHWIEQNIQELEKKRNDEIKRLLELFDENSNEALQYAIPLDSLYLQRGSQKQSSKLTRNPIKFNPNKLGGGKIIDSWNVGDYYNSLRLKYLNTAKKEIAQKDFKKAAFVYAHLLGDFYSAANVLEQGGMYREAASVYKEHLNNIASAAQCLERGGLYNEAIDLYIEMEYHEKTGDLYTTLQQQDLAFQYYEKHITTKLSSNDYLDAARVINVKMNKVTRAKDVLLKGWISSHQSASCLKNYFDIVLKSESDNTEKEVKRIYNHYTPPHQKLSFLDILEYVNKNKNEEAVAETTLGIAYEIVHNEIENGNVDSVNNLKRFLPKDRLIGSDTSRYTSANITNYIQSKSPRVLHLDQSVKWLKATCQRNQFLAIGIKNSTLQMARGNWYGNLEYYSWTNHVEALTTFTFVNAPYQNNTVILRSSKGLPITKKQLPKNKYFNESLVITSPAWLHNGTTQCVINDENNISSFDVAGQSMTLHHYDIHGNLKHSINCMFKEDQDVLNFDPHAGLVNHGDFYYTYSNKHFITISSDGYIKSFGLKSIIRLFASSVTYADLYLVISTNKGCFLVKPLNGNINVDENNYFAPDLIPSIIVFITPGMFIIAEKIRAVVFEITNDSPKALKTFEAHSTIVAVLPTSSRHLLALVEESGRIVMCDM